jgi:hypothetical protein
MPAMREAVAAEPAPSAWGDRSAARALVHDLRKARPQLLDHGGTDLGAALEQQLFFAIRDRRRVGPERLAWLRVLAAAIASLLPRPRLNPGPRPFVVLIRVVQREQALAGIDRELVRFGARPCVQVRVGAAAQAGRTAGSARLTDLLDRREVGNLLRSQLRIARSLRAATSGWAAIVGAEDAVHLRNVAARELPNLALGAFGLRSLVRRWQPALLAAFDEKGTWSRLLPAVARQAGIPTLNLPHSEAADEVAIAGADFDRVAAYGPRARAVLEAAGIPAERIVEIGAPLFDDLGAATAAAAAAAAADPGSALGPERSGPRRVVFAAQYVQGRLTKTGLEACLTGALAAAAAVTPSELVIVPHPLEQRGLIAGLAARHPVPPGVHVRIDRGGLHAALADAWLLVTGWSNSVFEAGLAGVPTILVDAEAASPVTYAEDGLGIGVRSDAEAAAAAARLLEPAVRQATLGRARVALEAHLGPLDGRASERAARLAIELAASPPGPPDQGAS